MAAIKETLNLGDLLKFEEACSRYSREQITVAAGQQLALGTVLGQITASSQYKAFDPAATDGSEVPAGILLAACDTSLAERDDGLMLARHGIVAGHALQWPAGITPTQQRSAIAALAMRGILIRNAA